MDVMNNQYRKALVLKTYLPQKNSDYDTYCK